MEELKLTELRKVGEERPLLLDLFCGCGGAAVGYARAGFDILGIDIKHQPNYPFAFVQADVIDVMQEWPEENKFSAIHASPPCQAYLKGTISANVKRRPAMIEATRTLLKRTKLPYVIENVQTAPLRDPLKLCGSMFNLGVDYQGETGPKGRAHLMRHRSFEVNFPVYRMTCGEHLKPTLGIYGDHVAYNRLKYGAGNGQYSRTERVRLAKEALQIDWTDNWEELKEAIPPAFTEYLGKQLIKSL